MPLSENDTKKLDQKISKLNKSISFESSLHNNSLCSRFTTLFTQNQAPLPIETNWWSHFDRMDKKKLTTVMKYILSPEPSTAQNNIMNYYITEERKSTRDTAYAGGNITQTPKPIALSLKLREYLHGDRSFKLAQLNLKEIDVDTYIKNKLLDCLEKSGFKKDEVLESPTPDPSISEVGPALTFIPFLGPKVYENKTLARQVDWIPPFLNAAYNGISSCLTTTYDAAQHLNIPSLLEIHEFIIDLHNHIHVAYIEAEAIQERSL